jgi:hypothetical protein
MNVYIYVKVWIRNHDPNIQKSQARPLSLAWFFNLIRGHRRAERLKHFFGIFASFGPQSEQTCIYEVSYVVFGLNYSCLIWYGMFI